MNINKYISTRFLLFIIVACVGQSSEVFAQCSDAGLCTVGGIHDLEKYSDGRVSLVYQFGKSPKEDSITYHTIRITEQYEFLRGSVAKFILPFNMQYGQLGTVLGVGDLIIAYEQRMYELNDSKILLEIGAKIATALQNVDSLPQKYQSGLGTNDLLLNAEYRAKWYFLSIGYQQPFGRSTNYEQLKRGPDLAVRIGYYNTFDKFNLTGELIAVKRFGTASIVYVPQPGETQPPEYVDVPNSDPFQLNASVESIYVVNKVFQVSAGFAFPFFKRDFNIDGLARSITAKIGFHYSH
jgi:hypothetical protein